MRHYFIIEGCRETGNYQVTEVNNKNEELIYTVENKKRGGLKDCRQYIGAYLQKNYSYSLNQEIPHQCVKPDRDPSKNPFITNSTVKDYLDGIDPLKK